MKKISLHEFFLVFLHVFFPVFLLRVIARLRHQSDIGLAYK